MIFLLVLIGLNQAPTQSIILIVVALFGFISNWVVGIFFYAFAELLGESKYQSKVLEDIKNELQIINNSNQ